MTTYTTLARGSEWGITELTNGFDGTEETDEEVSFLVKLTLDRFQDRMNNYGSAAYWQPQTSELIGPVDEDLDIDYEAVRDEIIEEVWDQWCAGDLTVTADE